MPIFLRNIKPVFGGKVRVGTTALTPRWLTDPLLNAVEERSAFSITVAAQYNLPIIFAVEGSLPSGFAFNPTTRTVSGTAPAVANTGGFASFTLRVTGSNGLFSLREFTLPISNVNLAPTWTTPAGSLGTVQGGRLSPYTFTLTANDSDGSIASYVATAGAVPPGFALAESGVLAGSLDASVTVDRTFNFAVTATDNDGGSATRSFSIAGIAAPQWITPANLGSVNEYTMLDRSLQVQYSGVKSFSIVGGSLPTGVTLNATTGALTGLLGNLSPVGSTPYTFTVRVTGAAGVTADREFTLNVVDVNLPPQWSTPSNLGAIYGQNGMNYDLILLATDSDGTVASYALDSGTLPAYLTLTPGGHLQGTVPNDLATGTVYNFVVRATDNAGASSTRAFRLTVHPSAYYMFSKDYTANGLTTAMLTAITQAPMENLVETNPASATNTYTVRGLTTLLNTPISQAPMENLVETDPAAAKATYGVRGLTTTIAGVTGLQAPVVNEIVTTPQGYTDLSSTISDTYTVSIPGSLLVNNEITAPPTGYESLTTSSSETSTVAVPASVAVDDQTGTPPTGYGSLSSASSDTSTVSTQTSALETI